MLHRTTYMAFIALAVSIAVATVFTSVGEIQSECVCYSDDPAEALEEADAVFKGVVVEKGRAQRFLAVMAPS